LREVGTLCLVGRGFPDHQRKFVDDDLDAGTGDVAAGLCRTDHGSDATCKVAHDSDVAGGAGAAGHAEKQGSGQETDPMRGQGKLLENRIAVGFSDIVMSCPWVIDLQAAVLLKPDSRATA
jgi:hypothetical protein